MSVGIVSPSRPKRKVILKFFVAETVDATMLGNDYAPAYSGVLMDGGRRWHPTESEPLSLFKACLLASQPQPRSPSG